MLQWGRSVSAAETPWPVRGGGATSRSFNGAAAFQLRKLGDHFAAVVIGTCFNGAAAFQLRKRSFSSCGGAPCGSFNGAAAFQLRKRHSSNWLCCRCCPPLLRSRSLPFTLVRMLRVMSCFFTSSFYPFRFVVVRWYVSATASTSSCYLITSLLVAYAAAFLTSFFPYLTYLSLAILPAAVAPLAQQPFLVLQTA